MSVRNITPQILARAASAQDVAEMSAWKESDVLALAESALAAVVAEHASGTVCNRVIDALRAADGSPHYTAEHHDTQVAVYVLCLSSPASHAEPRIKPSRYSFNISLGICGCRCKKRR